MCGPKYKNKCHFRKRFIQTVHSVTAFNLENIMRLKKKKKKKKGKKLQAMQNGEG